MTPAARAPAPGWRRLAALLLLVGGQSLGTVATSLEEDALEFRFGEGRLRAMVTERGLTGEDVELRWTEDGIEGHVRGLPVNLSWEERRIRGRLGELPVQFQIWEKARAGEEVEGRVGGVPSELAVSPTEIRGTLGECRYVLTLAGGQYRGWSDCPGSPAPVRTSLRLPPQLAALEDVERFGLLIPLLAHLSATPVLR